MVDREQVQATGPSSHDLVVVIDSLDVGGAEVQIVSTLPELVKSGWAVSLLTITGREQLAPALEGSGVRLHSRVRAEGRLGRVGRLIWLARTLVRLLGSRPKPAVYALLPYATLVAGPLALLLRCSLAVGRRSRNTYQSELKPVLRWLERQIVRRADVLIANAEPSRQDLIAEGADPAKIVVVPNGVHPDRVRTVGDPEGLRRELELERTSFVMLQVANFFPYKGHADVLAALAILAAEGRLPRHWTMIFAGHDPSGGDNMARLRSSAAELGLLEHLRFVGRRGDVGDLLAISDLAICASHQEALSNAVLEAMAAGLPVISTDVGDHRAALGNGHAGMLVPAGRPEELAVAIGLLIRDRDMRARMGASAAQRAAEQFSLQRSVALLSAVLDRIKTPGAERADTRTAFR
jgi:glycosyltransferase involved in cell wall biosynthesis